MFNVMSWSENMEAYVAAMTKLKELEPEAWRQLEILLSGAQFMTVVIAFMSIKCIIPLQ